MLRCASQAEHIRVRRIWWTEPVEGCGKGLPSEGRPGLGKSWSAMHTASECGWLRLWPESFADQGCLPQKRLEWSA